MLKILVLIYMYIFGYSCDTFVLVDEWNIERTAFICYLIFGQMINVSTVTFDHCNMSLLNNSSFEYIENAMQNSFKCTTSTFCDVQIWFPWKQFNFMELILLWSEQLQMHTQISK